MEGFPLPDYRGKFSIAFLPYELLLLIMHKHRFLVSLMLLCVVLSRTLFCQAQTKLSKPRSNTLGLGYRIPPMHRTNTGSEIGLDLMFMRFFTPRKAIRLMAGFQTTLFPQGKAIYRVQSDTLLVRTSGREAGTFFAGGGVQLQRPLFRRLVLTGAIDTRLHYGRGKENTTDRLIRLNDQQEIAVHSERLGGFSAFRWDLYPAAGIQCAFSRITFGFEVISRLMQYNRHIPYHSAVESLNQWDMDLGQMMGRFSLSYRW